MILHLLDQYFAICRLASDAIIPQHIHNLSFCAITRTAEELSIVLPESQAESSWQAETDWRGLMVKGPLDFGMVGVIAKISVPLAEAGIPIFVISTFDTDYLLVKADRMQETCDVLTGLGHEVLEGNE